MIVNVTDSQDNVYVDGYLTTGSSGEFLIALSINETGEYTIRAYFSDYWNIRWEGIAHIIIMEHPVDRIRILPNKAEYYAGETAEVTLSALRRQGSSSIGVPNITINGSLRYSNETIISSFNCVTGGKGTCNITQTAPSTVGTYILEANEFSGSTKIRVIPFDISVDTMDDTGTSTKTVYSTGQAGKIRVRVSYNGTNPTTGTYSFTGYIVSKDKSVKIQIPETPINGTTYTGWHSFTVNETYISGPYVAYITVSQAGVSQYRILAQGGSTVSARSYFEVRSFRLSVEKQSGFRYAYTAYPSTNVSFKITLTDLTTGNPVASLTEDDFNITLETRGTILSRYNATLNTTYYVLALTLPENEGTYTLRINAHHSGDTLEAQRTLTVASSMASATPADREGKLKELFNSVEYIYVKLSLESANETLNVTDIDLSSIRNSDGTLMNYTQTSNWSSDDNATLEWRKNTTSSMIKLDNPKSGGIYFIEVYLNNKTALAKTKFIIDPYTVVAQSQDKNNNQRQQFSATETVYLGVTVTQTQHSSGSAMMSSERGRHEGRMEGDGTAAHGTTTSNRGLTESTTTGNTTQLSGREVEGATITVEKIVNDRTFSEMPLAEVNYSCPKTNAQGQATCTLTPAGASWAGGWYHIMLKVTGPDNVTTGQGHAGFEVRSFYINAYSTKWMHRPNDDLTFVIYMYDAGNDMWWNHYSYMGGYTGTGTSGGLSGRVSIEKILRHGSSGEWSWPPTEYNYTGTLPTVTVENGQGNLTLRAPSGGWGSGSYSILLRGEKTDAGGNVTDTDYGDAWFEIRIVLPVDYVRFSL